MPQDDTVLIGVPQGDSPTTDAIPDKYSGKSESELVGIINDMETYNSRLGNQLGDLRSSYDSMLTAQSARQAPEPTPAKEVTVEDLLSRPDAVLSDVTQRAIDPRIEELQGEISEMRREASAARFETKYPDFNSVSQDVKFQNWVLESPLRQRLAKQANGYDYDSASELFELWEERVAFTKKLEPTTDPRDTQLKDADTIGTTASPTGGDKVFSRREVGKMMLERPNEYRNVDFQKELLKAYDEGRVVD